MSRGTPQPFPPRPGDLKAPGQVARGKAMVRFYTRQGDRGETGLLGGARVGKDSLRVEVYGNVDELSSHLGLAESRLDPSLRDVLEILVRLQDELFMLGAELATPKGAELPARRIEDHHVQRLEAELDRLSAPLGTLESFVLPRGTEAAAELHVTRTVARRTERSLVRLAREEPPREVLLRYLNRLSDLLFALALTVNRAAGFVERPPDHNR